MAALARLILRGGLSPVDVLEMGDDDPVRYSLIGRAITQSDELRKEELDYLANRIAHAMAGSGG